MRIVELQLATDTLTELKDFYLNTLELPLVSEDQKRFKIRAGATLLEFVAETSGERPFYHFAFTIPQNAFASAKEWITQRCALLTQDKQDEFHSDSWNSDGLYFLDPAGNILEFIARHNLRNDHELPFHPQHMSEISEIGLTVDNVPLTMDILRDGLGISNWKDYTDEFVAMGDEHGLFIVAKKQRPWMPTEDRYAGIYPTKVVVGGVRKAQILLNDYPYEIEVR